jgi:bifunctional DNase/RNase
MGPEAVDDRPSPSQCIPPVVAVTRRPTRAEEGLAMIETVVESIRVSLVTQHRVVILKEVHGERHLPIWIGAYEAEAIAMELQGVSAARPLPYDLMKSLIGDMGGAVDRIVVTDLSQDVFYARIVIQQNGRSVEVDSRPSDAIALAVRARVPILVDDSVMERAGVTLGADEGDEESAGDGADSPLTEPVDEERLSVFRDFINTLDLDDFDKKKGN